MEIITKTCFECGMLKFLTDFYNDRDNSDGRSGKCKKCTIARTIENKRKNGSSYRVPKRSVKSKLRDLEYKRKDRFIHPEKHRARSAVARALKNGTLVKGVCEVCGAPEVEAHHDDYSKQLSVRWLCIKHHNQLHGAVYDV